MKNLHKTLGIILASLILLSCQKKPVPPVISTTTATEISTVSAVSGGNITNDGGAPISSKGICWNTTTDPTIAHSRTSESGESLSFASNITQLIPSTLYYVRAYATNSAGTSYGKSESFKTLGDKPVSNSQNASNIQLNSATLNGNVNPNSLSTVVTFESGITINYGSAITAVQSPLTGNLPANVSVDLTGLTAGTIYHFRIKAENSLGITFSSDLTFTSLGQAPTATAQPASGLQVNSATLNGVVNPNLLSTSASFECGLTTSYGSTVTAVQNPVIGSTTQAITASLSGLNPGTTYHFRIKAENSLGVTYSSDLTFITLGQVPTVSLLPASNLQIYSATLNGTVNANYLLTSNIFEWGTTTSYGSTSVALQSPITGNTGTSISSNLSGLTPGTTYHFRIKAENILGITYSSDLTFTTLGAVPTATVQSISNLQMSTTTLHGIVNPNYLSTAVSFQWGPTTSYGSTGVALQSPVTGSSPANISLDLSGLTPGISYHFRISATNELGTTNSNDLTFTTLAPISDIDGNSYNIRTIGTQVWMTENLRVTKYSDGTSISFGLYYPSNNITNVTKFGYLYDWTTSTKLSSKYDSTMFDLSGQRVQGVCPTGWHLPSAQEWTELVDYYGGIDVAGLKLKNADPSFWSSPLLIEAPVSGFNAIAAGMRLMDGSYNAVGDYAAYWTSSQFWTGGGTIMGRQIYLINDNSKVFINITNTNNLPGSVGLSVRCLRD